MIATGGGRFDPSEGSVFFLATSVDFAHRIRDHHKHILIPLNEMRGNHPLEEIAKLLDTGCKLLVDSGIFWLTNHHARKTGITMDVALGIPPEQIPGFEELWSLYMRIVTRFADQLWGYIELDQGGRERKRETRRRLEAEGLSPIPVYHPLLDGWDYFDELAEGYDRLCFGNIVQADAATRTRLCHTAYERHRRYPELWVHLLGMTPNATTMHFPASSVDSSTWLSGVRWGSCAAYAGVVPFSIREPEMRYAKGEPIGGDSEQGYTKALRMAAHEAAFAQRAWRHWHGRLHEELGFERWPVAA